MREIQGESRSIQTELTAVNKALKLDPKNTELLKQKQDLLTKAIKQSKDNVELLKSAKDKADADMKNGTEVNQTEYRKLQREIAFSESKVKSFTEENKKLTTEIKKASYEIDVFGDKTEKLNSVADKMGKTAIGVGTALVGMAYKSGSTADDINTLSKTTGISTEEIQKFMYASEQIDVSIDTLAGSMSKLTKNMSTASKGSGDAYEAFHELGVEFQNQDGTLRNNQDVFDDVIAKLSEFENETERDAVAMNLFGKSAQDLNPLIMGGTETLKALSEEAEKSGFIMSQDTLDGANSLKDGIDQLKTTVTVGISKMGGSFATDLIPIVEKLIKVITSVINFISEHKALVYGIVAVLGSVAIAIKGVIAVQTVLNTVMMANPIGIVITAIVALVGAFVYLWNTSDTFREFWINLWEKAKEVCNFAINSVISGFNSVKDFIGKIFITDFTDKFGVLGNILNAWVQNIRNIFGPIKEVFQNIIDIVKNVFTGNWKSAWENIKFIFKGIFDSFVGIAKAPLNLVLGLINGLIDGINFMVNGINKISFKMPDWEWLPDSVQGKSLGFSIPVIPKVKYFAEGGILTEPTMFRSSINTAFVGGEAGAEAVIPLKELPKLMKEMGYINPESIETHVQIDGREIAYVTTPYISKELAFGGF